MTNPLNLYATKVFAEHPISMWAFDEQVGYISLINEGLQDLSGWNISGAYAVDATDQSAFLETPPQAPFQDSYVSGLIESVDNVSGLFNLTTIESVPDSSINTSLGSIALGFYAFTYDRTVQARLGFSYINPETSEEHEVVRLVNIPATRSWAFVAETFGLPESFSQIRPIIEFFYTQTELVYELAVNGISFGQWAEEFHTESLGTDLVDIPANIPINGKCVEAFAYGLQGKSGYYLASENNLYAINSGVPLVFGSSNSTVISPNADGQPSLILPGEGFMNRVGQYKPLTAEFWINIESNTIQPKRIFGPIGSQDGIYVEKHLIKLKVGENIGSHNIKEWGRPMLLGIRLTYNAASLIINGEEVISLSISPDSVDYPEDFQNGESLDWLGFYAYEDVPLIKIEAVAIYPYEVAAIVQKRRFVYGQGVDFPVSSKGLDNSTVVSIDYSLSNYAKNVNYPETNSWSAGYSDNLESDNTFLSLPSYALPDLFINNKNKEDWFVDNLESYNESSPAIYMKPSGEWSGTESYLYFKNLSSIKDGFSGFFGLFETPQDNVSKQILLKFEQTSENSALSIYLENESINYSISYIGADGATEEDIFYQISGNQPGDRFVVGLNIAQASSYFGSRVASFLGTLQSAKLYVGGQQSYQNTFSGGISKIAFCNLRNSQKLENIFGANGLGLDYQDGSLAADSNKETHVGTYTLVPRINIDKFSLDISTDCYWEDYVPLSYFGKYVKDYSNEDFFALDFIQFNIDYVKLNRFSDGNYDTSGLPIKTYVSFQYLRDGANANPNYFSRTEPLSKTGVIKPGEDWLTTRYEILNDSIIKLPLGESISSLALVVSIEFVSNGILQDNLSVGSLQLASQALGQSPNRIGTRFGQDIIPFKKSGLYFEYKNVEPFSIYKKDSPYLYLTKNSGIRMRSEYNSSGRDGLSIPLNSSRSSFFKINLFQMFLRYEEADFPIAPVQLFEIQSVDSLVKFFLVADSNTRQRGQIYAIDDTTGRLKSGVVYYIDGKVVKRPILNLKSWSVLGISFDTPQDFSSFTGALRFTSPIIFNNVSYYQTTQLDELQRFAFRKWSAVRSGIDNPLDWGYWAGKNQTPEGEVYVVSDGFSWQEVLFLTEADPVVPDAKEVYDQYAGTNSTIFDSGSSLRLSGYRSSVLKDISWSTSTSTPV